MRRHYTNYLKGLSKIKKHRMKLVTQKFYEEIEESRKSNRGNYTGFAFEHRRVMMEKMARSCG